METNRRYNRERREYRNPDRDSQHYKRVDEDMYRGAYRFDNESDHSNETTYDGFDLNDSMARHDESTDYRNENNQGGDYVYRRSRNLEDNDRRYNESGSYREYDRYDQRRRDNQNQSYYKDRYGDGDSNFNNSYAPDPYRNKHRDQNYGNMGGSLSFGYDGDYNSDPEYRRRYNPLSGEIRRDHDEDRRKRHPGHYGPPDRSGMNPDYDRY